MIVKSYNKEEMLSICTLKRFYQNKHMLLLGIGIREISGEENTVIDIKDAFNISKIYAWKLLGGLEKEGLVEKKEKTKKEERNYYNYALTEEAKDNLRILSSWLLNFNISGETIDLNNKHYLSMFLTSFDTEVLNQPEMKANIQ